MRGKRVGVFDVEMPRVRMNQCLWPLAQMNMNKAIVNRIRPMSWKVCVQGKEEAEYVRSLLAATELDCSECDQEVDLVEPPVYSFIASPKIVSPLTSVELRLILNGDERIEIAFPADDE